MSSSSMISTSYNSSSTSSPATPSLPNPSSKNGPKPVKLRAACNHCFSAKVRCDGNKKGCRRCSEKGLSCVYSESRVGRVVGKRRKRPIDQSVTEDPLSQAKVINTANSIQSIQSPANTQGSEDWIKRHCSQPICTTFVAESDQGFLSFDEAMDSLDAMEMKGNRSYSLASDVSFFPNSGLPTPALSPPQYTRYLSPAQLPTRPASRQASLPLDYSKLHPSSYSVPLAARPHPAPEDEETVCIKLLAHLKRHGRDALPHRGTQIELLRKCNAVVQRVLGSKTLRSDYPCQLVLSSIMNHLVRLSELLCDQIKSDLDRRDNADSQFLQDQLHFEVGQAFLDGGIQQQAPVPADRDMIVAMVNDVLFSTSRVGDLLKKKPLNGFQTLGRHETFHIELELRLKRVITMLQS